MLVAKKMSAKKTAVYTGIIILMLTGTAWVIYNNQKVAAPQPASILINSQLDNTAVTETDMAKIKNNGQFDLSIFNSDKYKQLKENIIAPEGQPVTGKRDPFKPN